VKLIGKGLRSVILPLPPITWNVNPVICKPVLAAGVGFEKNTFDDSDPFDASGWKMVDTVPGRGWNVG
jgi:hypothetical protein